MIQPLPNFYQQNDQMTLKNIIQTPGLLLLFAVPMAFCATANNAITNKESNGSSKVEHRTVGNREPTSTVVGTCTEGEVAATASKNDRVGLHVSFSIERPEGRRYRRPYLAVWLEDADGFPVKTGILWLQTDQPGPRWHRDLTRWFRNDRMRKVVEKINLIDGVDGISGPTRGPGKYEVHFDGTDNTGDTLPAGVYTLCLEAAREHGTYKIIREKFEWGTKSIERKLLKGNVEIPAASYEFVAPKF